MNPLPIEPSSKSVMNCILDHELTRLAQAPSQAQSKPTCNFTTDLCSPALAVHDRPKTTHFEYEKVSVLGKKEIDELRGKIANMEERIQKRREKDHGRIKEDFYNTFKKTKPKRKNSPFIKSKKNTSKAPKMKKCTTVRNLQYNIHNKENKSYNIPNRENTHPNESESEQIFLLKAENKKLRSQISQLSKQRDMYKSKYKKVSSKYYKLSALYDKY
ncbi:unnamed protein product [Moneuplotes crassus]|uniref:Uncharacterized protein n=1 Tax=Euplotes crassus TaxID=5936 RepID=A0AAD1UD21_EUPCR|nr:unnamed protein product [Moneuplotes crassus]